MKPDIRGMIFQAGGPTLVGQKLNVVPNLISVWMTRNQVPANWVMTLAPAINKKPYQIRPDIWFPPVKRGAK
jgi:hypothetical protein